ncbi:hypothetical protein [Rivibacter subsaxonicus]|uniref:Uncharacterized protein n=1 Tax=Rivibacter subsaxonicus TaxID=457575 RepID=A0A4Q7VW90_9BURK|nr:hypothetical protein [Rivibacter subsaxonicus]RZU00992.1 hypothetical protein EV670_1705 [Rivibacter subsaxonicus]
MKQTPASPLLARALRALENARRIGGAVHADTVLIDLERKLVAAAFGKAVAASGAGKARARR